MYSNIIKKFGLSLRRLAFFSDGVGKVRIIAISDWLTQNTLRPLHHLMFSKLKEIKQDYTFDQGRSIETARSWFYDKKEIYCFDLTAATDRLPLLIQGIILQQCGLPLDGVKA